MELGALEAYKPWPIFPYLLGFCIGFFLYLFFSPVALGTSPNANLVFMGYSGISIIYLARLVIARIRKEQSKVYTVYIIGFIAASVALGMLRI